MQVSFPPISPSPRRAHPPACALVRQDILPYLAVAAAAFAACTSRLTRLRRGGILGPHLFLGGRSPLSGAWLATATGEALKATFRGAGGAAFAVSVRLGVEHLIPTDVMVDKVQAAVDACEANDFLVSACCGGDRGDPR